MALTLSLFDRTRSFPSNLDYHSTAPRPLNVDTFSTATTTATRRAPSLPTMHNSQYSPPTHTPMHPPPILPANSGSGMSDAYRLPPPINTSSVASTANAEAGPSNSPTSAASSTRRKNSSTVKKKRSAAEDPGDEANGDPQTQKRSREGPKKKKAARACFHCQKAHLTCDDSRPCQRCSKRGIGDQCTEGHRKKAKYLLDEAELVALKSSKAKSPAKSTPEQSQPPELPNPVVQSSMHVPQSAHSFTSQSTDSIFNVPFDPNYTFGSEAANLEYSSLSALLSLGGYGADQSFLSSDTPPAAPAYVQQQFANPGWPEGPAQQPMISPQGYNSNQNAFNMGYSNVSNGQFVGQQYGVPMPSPPVDQQLQVQVPQQIVSAESNRYPTPDMPYPPVSVQSSQSSYGMRTAVQANQSQTTTSDQASRSTNGAPGILNQTPNHSLTSLASPPASDSPNSAGSSDNSGHGLTAVARNANSAREEVLPSSDTSCGVYQSVTKAFDYTESYHFLMKFLPTRFGKNDILRVIRALAIYRPSIISLQSSMSDEDFVFMEKCLRRSLVELEKLISFSGTPTVVWRRTGEILLAGAEFCLLTDWTKEDLVIERKYIYELFENQSIVEYWEKFASHAFENTTQSVYSHCVLLKPSGEPVPCTFCFSIRRDIFDLPSVVIGQWLPLL